MRLVLQANERFSPLNNVYKVYYRDGVHVPSAAERECLEIWRVTANKLNKYLHTSDKEYFSSVKEV
jgi:hypothetical protein